MFIVCVAYYFNSALTSTILQRYLQIKMDSVLCSFLLTLMVVLCDGERNGKPITCHAGTFAPGDQASVTCNLHAVNTTGAGVNLVRYPPGASEHNPGDNILFCSWHKHEHKHHCTVEKYCSSDDGCRFNGSVGDTVTVNFPSVSHRHAGLYMCFLLPSAGTDPHGCEFLVKENIGKRSTVSPVLSRSGSDGQPDQLLPMVIFLGLFVVALLATLVVIAIIYWRGIFQRRTLTTGGYELTNLLPNETNEAAYKFVVPVVPVEIEDELRGFRLPLKSLKAIMKSLQDRLAAYTQGRADTNNTMFSTQLNRLPNKTETGTVLVVNLISRWLTVSQVHMQGSEMYVRNSVNYNIPKEIRKGKGTELFDFIASRISRHFAKYGLREQDKDLAFVVCFPCNYEQSENVTSVKLTRLTQEFCCSDVEKQSVEQLLKKALEKKGLNLDIKAVVNDCVAMLLVGFYKNPLCNISFLVGHGVTGSFLQDAMKQCGSSEIHTKKVITNAECGSLGEDDCLKDYRTAFDEEIDASSAIPTQQILEKMISKLYIGRIVRLILSALIREGRLFDPENDQHAAFFELDVFSTDHVLLIDRDTSEDFMNTKLVVQGLKVEAYTDDDCRVVKYVCHIVVERAAYLAAAALSALIKHVKQHNVAVIVDGFLYKCHPRFRSLMEEKTRELVGWKYEVQFMSTKDGGSKGAALTVAVSSPPSQISEKETPQSTRA